MRLSSLWKVLAAAPLAAVPALAGSGCESGGSECQTPQTYFQEEVWGDIIAAKCVRCHTPEGVAVLEKGAKFVLQGPSYPGFLDVNFKMMEEISRVDVDGKPILLVKPTGGNNHGGGEVIEEGSEEYEALKTLVDKIKNPPDCGEVKPAAVEGVTMLSPAQTFRKAAIHLAGRLPTADEYQLVATEDGLDAALDGLMTEDAFLERVREMFNDSILTDRFDRNNDGLFLVNEEDFPKIYDIRDNDVYADRRRDISRAIAREPLNLVAYVVQQDRPITEILTAPYVIANPFNAELYGISGFVDPTNQNEFKEVQLTTYDGTSVPHAGILTTSSFLTRWPTTPTNRSRGRARQVFKSFLAFNVLKISERPVDASKITAVDNPTMNSLACSVCHQYIDPVAGHFRGWSENGDYTKFYVDADWHNDMVSPGFNGEQMPPDFYNKGLAWGAAQIAKDPRFVIAMVHTVYTGITGKEPLAYPSSDDPEFTDKLAAWSAQDAFFHEASDDLVASDYNLKTVVKDVLESPYYRASGVTTAPESRLTDVGSGRLLTPEMLNRKIRAITGIYWGYYEGDGYRRDMLHRETGENYFLLYGGMDSFNVVKHVEVPNGTIAAVATRMANELSCELTAWDFTKAAEARRFFPLVDPTIVPESAGNEVPASVTLIKQNIAYLHHLILGEDLTENDPEVERTYTLFLETWRELASAEAEHDLPWECRGLWDPSTGLDLPEDLHIHEDPTYTIRAWQAVMAYLMMDYRFIYE